jgi:methylmalonyl-CoA epimerase
VLADAEAMAAKSRSVRGGSGASRPQPRIHHIGIAVRSLEEAAGRFGGLLGLQKGARYELPELGVKVLFLPVGGSNLELLEPLGQSSTVASFLEKRGEGMHHVCFEVDDIESALAEFKSKGAILIDEKPRPGAGGHLVAFVHPKSTHGVLVELKQS